MTWLDQVAIDAIDGAWLAWLAIWIAMARRVKKTALRESLVRRATHLLPLALAGALMFVCPPGPGSWTCSNIVSRGVWMAPAGALAVCGGLGFAVWARVALAGNWSGIVTLKEDHQLVRAGPYGVVRHPIYTGLLTALLGTALAVDQWRGVLSFCIITASFLAKIQTEETFMSHAFGKSHESYCRQTARLIPWIW